MGKRTWKCHHIRYAPTAISTRTKEKGTRIIVVTAAPACSGFHTPSVAEQTLLRQNYTQKKAPYAKVLLWFTMVRYCSSSFTIIVLRTAMQVVILSLWLYHPHMVGAGKSMRNGVYLTAKTRIKMAYHYPLTSMQTDSNWQSPSGIFGQWVTCTKMGKRIQPPSL